MQDKLCCNYVFVICNIKKFEQPKKLFNMIKVGIKL